MVALCKTLDNTPLSWSYTAKMMLLAKYFATFETLSLPLCELHNLIVWCSEIAENQGLRGLSNISPPVSKIWYKLCE